MPLPRDGEVGLRCIFLGALLTVPCPSVRGTFRACRVAACLNRAARHSDRDNPLPRRQVVDSDQAITVGGILSRIRANAERLETKVGKKMAAEADHFKAKHGIESYNTGTASAGGGSASSGSGGN